MAPTRKRSSSSTAISQMSIEQVGSKLTDLPEKPKESMSLREAVSLLQDPITTALNRGYSYDEVVSILADQGIRITVASLKRYLAMARRERTTTGRRRTGTRSRQSRLNQQVETLTTAASLNGAGSDSPNGATPVASSKPARKPRATKTAAKTKSSPAAAAPSETPPRKSTGRASSGRKRSTR